MDYNLAGIRQRVVLDKLDDEEFDPGIVDRFINDTQRDIFNQFELPFQEKIFEGSLQPGVVMFGFPTDLAQLQSITVTSPGGSQKDLAPYRLNFQDFNKRYQTPLNEMSGDVQQWALYAGNMLLSRPTDQEYKLTLFYIRKPLKLETNEQVPEIPEEFSELLVLGAYRRILQRDGDYDLAAVVKEEYGDQLNLMVSRYGYRIAQGPIIMGNKQIRTRGR